MIERLRRLVNWGSGSVAAALAAAIVVGCSGDYTAIYSGNDFLDTGRTQSFFSAVQVDPRSEDSAGPQFAVVEDLNGDGLLDVVSAWNQSQPVQIHLQQRSGLGAIMFETVTLGGNIPVVAVAGLGVADMDGDGVQDIALLIKESLLCGAECLSGDSPSCADDALLSGAIVIYFGPSDPAQATQALAWEDQSISASFLAGFGESRALPELGGYSSMALGDMDSDGDTDIITAWNSFCDGPQVLIFTNNGPTATRDGNWPRATIPDPFRCPPTVDIEQCPEPGLNIKHVALGDLDRDGDQDIVATYPPARSMNVRWYRNPTIDVPDLCHQHTGEWLTGTIGQVEAREGQAPSGGADVAAVADVDRDGILDVVVRSTGGRILQWLKGPDCPTTPTGASLQDPYRNIPWRVYSLAEFREAVPHALAVGDIDRDGQVEVVASASGALVWLEPRSAGGVYDPWVEQVIVADLPGAAPQPTDPDSEEEVDTDTLINSIRIVDLDGDGSNDLIATFDRTGLSGLTNDALVWFRNMR